jgi:hypothetical protein
MEAPHKLSPDLDDAQLFVRTILEQDFDFEPIFDQEHAHQKINIGCPTPSGATRNLPNKKGFQL